MPVYDLKLKAELDNVESIAATEEVEVPGTRGTCNCLYTCKS